LESLAAERQFFAALLEAGLGTLDRVLSNDFILIDVMSGSEFTKSTLVALIGSGGLKFEAIEPADNLVRLYQTTAVICRPHANEGAVQRHAVCCQQPLPP
jgi:hypothetical protein